MKKVTDEQRKVARGFALDAEASRMLDELCAMTELSASAQIRAMIRGEHRRRAARKARQEARASLVAGQERGGNG